MRTEKKFSRKNDERDIFPERKNGVAKCLAYTPPQYRTNKAGCYIEFYAYDPASGGMRRKRVKVNHIDGSRNRKQYAKECITRYATLLSDGWNPWIDCDPDDIELFDDCLDRYEEHVQKQHSNGLFRKQTYDEYKSKIKIIRSYIESQKPKDRIRYMFQYTKRWCIDFLDYVYIERNNGAQTFNNYLRFLRTISQWWFERGIIAQKPTDSISPISKRLFAKERTCIPIDTIRKIGEWTRKNDPHFCFACQILYYCFIRPVEMTRLRIRDFNIKEGTVTIHADASKNKRTQTVTIPKKVLMLGIELGIFSAPMGDYVFSTKLRPGSEQINTKIFRDHWAKVSNALKLKKEWKFYSLKDTGITEMLRQNTTSPVNVKEQARHSSLVITEIYIGEHKEAVPEILELDGAL
ncbi:MAG: tyrosine-type recombinase/integrase [Muribaculaceae bacterium]|nr:tyrosine-type recombinase/integrase [Muribaculaceae bacterium]